MSKKFLISLSLPVLMLAACNAPTGSVIEEETMEESSSSSEEAMMEASSSSEEAMEVEADAEVDAAVDAMDAQ